MSLSRSLALTLLALASTAGCQPPRRPRPRFDPSGGTAGGEDPARPDDPGSASPSPRPRAPDPLHVSSYTLRKQALEKALEEAGKAPRRDILLLYRSDGAALDRQDPALSGEARVASERLKTRVFEAGGGELLAEMLRRLNDPACPVRPALVLTLAPVPTREVYDAIARGARQSEAPVLRAAAIKVLAGREESAAAADLAPAFRDERSGPLAARALLSLSRSENHRSAIEETVLGTLAGRFSREAKLRAAELAARLKINAAGSLMTEWLEPGSDPALAAAALAGLQKLPSPFAIRRLRAAVADPRPAVRAGALRALTAQKDVLSRDAFRELSRKDEDPRVRVAALEGIAAIGDLGAERPVLAALADLSPEVRVAAARAAARLEIRGAELSVRPWLKPDASLVERRAAAELVGALRDAPSTPRLLELLESDEPSLRGAAGAALVRIGGAEALAGMEKALAREREPRVLLSHARACRGVSGPSYRRLAAPLIAIAAPRPAADLIAAAAVLAAYDLGSAEAGARVGAAGDAMLVLLRADRPADRLQGARLLREIAGRDFGYEPESPKGPREALVDQIEKWWQARRERYVGS